MGLVVVALVVAVLAGCHDDDVSKGAYIAQMQALEVHLERGGDAALPLECGRMLPRDLWLRRARQLSAAGRAYVDGLELIEPPDEVRSEHNAYVGYERAVQREIDGLVAGVASGTRAQPTMLSKALRTDTGAITKTLLGFHGKGYPMFGTKVEIRVAGQPSAGC